MKKSMNLEQTVRGIVSGDPRYDFEAYQFVLEALEYTYGMISERRHVTGKELIEGARRYAIERYGGMARVVLEHWRINRCEDIGEIVFNLVEHGLLSKTERDSRDDFKGGYDFKEAFDDAFENVKQPRRAND